ncbi:MAG: synthase subunit [Actinomycetota bacterium]|jgi:F-type H+-transporting ATPase subunit b
MTSTILAETGGAGLIQPELGLSLWTLVTFLIVLVILRKYAFGRIAALLDERREAVRQNLQAAEDAREEAERLLDDYKQQLAAAKREAAEILENARATATEQQRQLVAELSAERERGIAAAQQAIAAETQQSLDRIKQEIADLTLLATEKVLGRALDDKEQKRLVEEALAGVDFSALHGGKGGA